MDIDLNHIVPFNYKYITNRHSSLLISLSLPFSQCQCQGVQKIMVPGGSVRSSKEALRLTRIYPGIIYSTAGIHPHDSKSVVEDPESWIEFCAIAQNEECVAIGPCGLDYQRDFSEPEVQREIFEKQIRLACDLEKPILIHERSAQSDVLDILTK